jgi:aminoglycoside 6-adenylyltransferase
MMENPVRRMFMKIIKWRIGADTNFSVSFGKDGKFMHRYLSAGDYNNILKTYPDFKIENIWNSLFLMTGLFSRFANEMADKLMFKYNMEEEENSMAHLQALYNESV